MLSWYIDSSAILKLLISENESIALAQFLDAPTKTSAISRVEVIRSLNRIAPEKIIEGQALLSKFEMTPASAPILILAENFPTAITLKSLDAIHVATVVFLNKTVEGLVTYDKQMIENAKKLGLTVVSPGMK
ncbi:MAG: PIN domain-containing protein [Actinobacteria bacterium]|nr:PIN domain-containing protein [Actinomycetota bacterium]MTA72811.1 PIN domain-containing protein [Actinomycetota bacterium]MTB29453.1 PIN domain-containing protein [Actinomycetota bacterium]